MPTLPYLTDTSTQLSGTYTTSAAALDNYTTSNYVSNVSNLLINNINTKQAILTASTSLLGVGSAISALDYNNITLNKPTYFPIDPAIYYNKTQTDSLLAAKEQILTFSSPLTRSTNTIGINLGSYSTSGADPAYLLKTGGTMTGALINTSTITSEFKAIQIYHSPSKITNIPYLGDNKIYLRAPVIIDYDNLSFGSRIADNLIYLYGTNYGLGINGSVFRLNADTSASFKFYSGTTNTATIGNTGIITATTFAGSGASLTNVPYSALTGTVPFYTKGEADTLLNAKQPNLTASTNLLGIGSSISALDYNNITLNKPTYFAIDPSIYYTQTQISNISNLNSNYTTIASNILNTKIDTKQNILTAATTILGTGGSITGINYNTLINKLTFTSPLSSNLSTNVISIDLSAYATNTNLATKENILTFSSPLTRTTNTIGINLSAYSTSGTDTAYVLKTGSTMTGALNGTSISCTGNITLGTDNSYPDLRLGSANGNNIAIATGAGAFSGSSAINDMVIRSLNKLILQNGGGNAGIVINNNNVGIGNSVPMATLSIGRPDIVDNDGTLVISKKQGLGNRNFKMGYDTNFNFCFGDFGGAVSGNTWASSHFLINYASGYIGIGTTNIISKLTIKSDYGDSNTGICINAADVSNTYNLKIYPFVQAGSQVGYKFTVNNIASSVEALKFYFNGGVNISSYLNIKDRTIYADLFNSSGFDHGTITDFNNITDFGYRFINAPATNGPGTPSNPASQYYTWMIGLGANYPYTQFGAQFCLPRNIGNPVLSVRYRDNSGVWGGWTGITAEALTAGNKTISGTLTVNDSMYFRNNVWQRGSDGSQRIYFGEGGRSYYQGYGSLLTDYNHEWRNHVGTGVMLLSYGGSLLLAGEIVPTMTSVSSTNTDYCGVSFNSAFNGVYQTSIKILYGTFTGIHRCFTEDELYNKEEPQKFKDDYVGRIVISTGKIATDNKTENETEWNILYDKEGITIEDALPIIQLSRKKKDKRVFGVLGLPSRNNSRAERMIINSIGEGAIYVINSNGNIENGDYITSSDYLGYGEKQDDDLLHNYTVAKATIDCSFELDSDKYNCYEIDELDANGNKLRVAFIAATYHCG